MLQNGRAKKPMIPTQPPRAGSSTMRPSINSDGVRPFKAPRPSMNSKAMKRASNEKGNIQVILRCKGNNGLGSTTPTPTLLNPDKSDPEKSIILSTNNTLYQFDRVFDENTTQEQIYNEVAKPVLYEVLKGYSCTIFAYGQTGTGKTYTMEGDLSEAQREHGKNAGIIPRTIHQLFEILEQKDDQENSVMVSMLELYNEDLRDLLCAADDQKPLNMFEDKDTLAVKVQNIQEHPISSAAQGLEIMKRGVKKRMTAATNINDKSSRSHSIFTVTVHLHEVAANGEDVYRIGKLNLVDLAGSENSRNAGSELIRAREAASINKSLLTLGRVINSLVDGAPHIPYRESKLTRLLKDSLGGRTKTYIIATVSPTQQTTEELRSTLDYASHAKGICNKPQENNPISRERRLDSLVKTIEQLYEELRINQEKHGVYQSKKAYDTMKFEHQTMKENIATLEARNNDLKAVERHIKDEAARNVEQAMAKVKVLEDSIVAAKKEKEELIVQQREKESKMEMDFKLKRKQIELDFKAREQKLIDEFKEKETKMQQEANELRRKHKDSIDSMIQFRSNLNRDNNTKWESFISTINKTCTDVPAQDYSLIRDVTANEASVPTTSTANHVSATTSDNSNRKILRPEVENPRKAADRFSNSVKQRKRERDETNNDESPRPSKMR